MRRWSVTGCRPDLIKFWDDHCVLFNTSSGQTHQLNALGGAALRLLMECPMAVGEVAAALAVEFDAEADAAWIEQFEQLIAQLDRLGLIEPAS